MGNTKALEVARLIHDRCVWADANGSVRWQQKEAVHIIQAAIEEATADIRTQLAERDAQLAAMRSKMIACQKALNAGSPQKAREQCDAALSVVYHLSCNTQIAQIAREAGSGICATSLTGKHAALRAITKITKSMGYSLLGEHQATRQPTPNNPWCPDHSSHDAGGNALLCDKCRGQPTQDKGDE